MSGYYWHVRHDVLIEWSDNIQERNDCIRKHKPTEEIETRLRLLKPVVGPLPPEWDKAAAEWRKADAEWDKAAAEWDKAAAERDKAAAEWDKARAEWRKARAECAKAAAEWRKARAECAKAAAERDKADAEHRKEIEALHAVECPGCPWDGKTIFPGRAR